VPSEIIKPVSPTFPKGCQDGQLQAAFPKLDFPLLGAVLLAYLRHPSTMSYKVSCSQEALTRILIAHDGTYEEGGPVRGS
jgi:hypothetical protein